MIPSFQKCTYLLDTGSELLDGSSKQLLLGIVDLTDGKDLLNTGFLLISLSSTQGCGSLHRAER